MARNRDRSTTDRAQDDRPSRDMEKESSTPDQGREQRDRDQIRGGSETPPDRSRPERKPGRLPLPD